MQWLPRPNAASQAIGEKFLLALSQQRAGDVAAARATYQSAVQDIQRDLEKVAPDSYPAAGTHAALGLAYAGLGEAASAIAEGQKAMAMHPTSKDPFDGPGIEEDMAAIYALLGDADHAIPILKRLLQIPYGRSNYSGVAATRSGGGIKSATILAFRNWPQKRSRESKELRRRSKRRECLQRCRCLCRN